MIGCNSRAYARCKNTVNAKSSVIIKICDDVNGINLFATLLYMPQISAYIPFGFSEKNQHDQIWEKIEEKQMETHKLNLDELFSNFLFYKKDFFVCEIFKFIEMITKFFK